MKLTSLIISLFRYHVSPEPGFARCKALPAKKAKKAKKAKQARQLRTKNETNTKFGESSPQSNT